MYTERLFDDCNNAADLFEQHLARPGIVLLWVTCDDSIALLNYDARAALVQLSNGSCLHMKVGDHEPQAVPFFDVAWFDGVEAPDGLREFAKPGAVVLLSGQPTEGSGVA